MQQLKKVILTLLIITGILSCSEKEDRIDIRDYYFPINNLVEGEVYEFASVNNDSLAPEYWYYKTLNTDTAIYLTGTYYDSQFKISQVFGEEVVDNGSLMYNYLLYESDSSDILQPINVQIEVPNVIPFQVRDTQGIFLFKMKWSNKVVSPTDSNAFVQRTTTLIRNRRYKGKQDFDIMNEKKECVVFEVKEIIETEEVGFQELELIGEERYAKGIGLVYYRKDISPDLILEYQLVDRYPMSQLLEKFEKMNEVIRDDTK